MSVPSCNQTSFPRKRNEQLFARSSWGWRSFCTSVSLQKLHFQHNYNNFIFVRIWSPASLDPPLRHCHLTRNGWCSLTLPYHFSHVAWRDEFVADVAVAVAVWVSFLLCNWILTDIFRSQGWVFGWVLWWFASERTFTKQQHSFRFTPWPLLFTLHNYPSPDLGERTDTKHYKPPTNKMNIKLQKKEEYNNNDLLCFN